MAKRITWIVNNVTLVGGIERVVLIHSSLLRAEQHLIVADGELQLDVALTLCQHQLRLGFVAEELVKLGTQALLGMFGKGLVDLHFLSINCYVQNCFLLYGVVTNPPYDITIIP